MTTRVPQSLAASGDRYGLPDAVAHLPEARARRTRSLLTTAALAVVLAALVAFTLWGTLKTDRAATAQDHALTLDDAFSDARAAVALEQVELRTYQLEPSNAGYARYLRAADEAGNAMHRAAASGSTEAVVDATRLSQEQAVYRTAADLLMAQVGDRDPASTAFDRQQVEPAYYTLQQDVESVSREYHSNSLRLADELRRIQSRILLTTVIGFVFGLGLVAVIWRVMLGYQRRLAAQADASEYLALHDPLTGLPNRSLFQRRLEAVLRRREGRQLAVMLVDLNDFKIVNDTLGHPAGDELLAAISRRLVAALKESDTVARLGGDEFAVLVPTVPSTEAATEIAQRVGSALRQDFSLAAGSAAVSGSVGLTIGSATSTAETLLRQADAAMYRAKNTGKGVVVYDADLDTEQPDRMALFGELRALLDSGDPDHQLVLYYQPQVSIRDASVPAVEALVRWQHPEHGLLLPGAFLPIAEGGRLDIPLTYHLLCIAVREAMSWRAAGTTRIVAVNVSPRCLADERFVDQVRSALADSGLPPSLLRLEVTESSMMTDPDQALAVLQRVQEDGVELSIDDFGTGFSSLIQLKRLTADELKIDQSLARDVASDPGDAVLVRSAIDLAHNLGLFVTAEGVEDLRTLATLRDLGCDQAQGYGLARPVPAEGIAIACAEAERRARTVTHFELAVPRGGAKRERHFQHPH